MVDCCAPAQARVKGACARKVLATKAKATTHGPTRESRNLLRLARRRGRIHPCYIWLGTRFLRSTDLPACSPGSARLVAGHGFFCRHGALPDRRRRHRKPANALQAFRRAECHQSWLNRACRGGRGMGAGLGAMAALRRHLSQRNWLGHDGSSGSQCHSRPVVCASAPRGSGCSVQRFQHWGRCVLPALGGSHSVARLCLGGRKHRARHDPDDLDLGGHLLFKDSRENGAVCRWRQSRCNYRACHIAIGTTASRRATMEGLAVHYPCSRHGAWFVCTDWPARTSLLSLGPGPRGAGCRPCREHSNGRRHRRPYTRRLAHASRSGSSLGRLRQLCGADFRIIRIPVCRRREYVIDTARHDFVRSRYWKWNVIANADCSSRVREGGRSAIRATNRRNWPSDLCVRACYVWIYSRMRPAMGFDVGGSRAMALSRGSFDPSLGRCSLSAGATEAASTASSRCPPARSTRWVAFAATKYRA